VNADVPVLQLILALLAGLLGLALLLFGFITFMMALSHRSTGSQKLSALALAVAGGLLVSLAVYLLL
jgi:hypothetical protein